MTPAPSSSEAQSRSGLSGFVLLACLSLTAALPATELGTLLGPGWLRYSAEPRFELQRNEGSRGLSIQSERYTLPLILQYGLLEGMEAIVELPFVRYGASSISNATPAASSTGTRQSEFGAGDLALGFKYRLLEDSGRTPAFFIQPLLKLPTGTSSLEAYARNLAGESVQRGTGSGSFDLLTSIILSVYADPIENYVRLTYDMRGGDERQVNGVFERVDYGTRTSLLGGLAVDLGERWSLAAESLVVVSQASVWRSNGVDVLSLHSADMQSFRAATLAQSNINLGSTTEWYIGPKIGFRLAKGFAVALRFEAGLSPDALPYRGGLELSGAFKPGGFMGRFKRKSSEAASETAQASGDSDRGNLQRYLFQRLRLAEKAAAEPAWTKAADELARLLELLSLDPSFKGRLEDLQLRLLAHCESLYQTGLTEGTKALKDLPACLRGLDPSRSEVQALRSKLAAKAHELHLQGQDLYIKDKTKEALELWTAAALMNPGDKALQKDIERARAKLKAIQSLVQ